MRHEVASIVRERLCDDCTYWEPFAGAASVLFTLHDIQSACLCDVIEPLIRTYKAIKDEPIEVWRSAQEFGGDGINAYYFLREVFNDFLTLRKKPKNEYELAGLFIYLNACCYNGLWRQNAEGEFNVPVSDRKTVKIPKQRTFLSVGQILQRTDLRLMEPPTDIFKVIDESRKGDVIFSDPPYYGTFDGYDGLDISSEMFQETLADVLQKAHKRGVTVIAMNSNEPFVRKLYRSWCRIKTINRHQTVASTNSGRKEWQQILGVSK